MCFLSLGHALAQSTRPRGEGGSWDLGEEFGGRNPKRLEHPQHKLGVLVKPEMATGWRERMKANPKFSKSWGSNVICPKSWPCSPLLLKRISASWTPGLSPQRRNDFLAHYKPGRCRRKRASSSPGRAKGSGRRIFLIRRRKGKRRESSYQLKTSSL